MNEIVDEENYPIIPWKLELKFQNSGEKRRRKVLLERRGRQKKENFGPRDFDKS